MKLADLSRWIDPATGMIAAKDGGTDNLTVTTATAIQFLDPQSKAELRVRFCEFMKGCEVERGLYARRPGDRGRNSVDNLVGALALSYHLETDHRIDALWYAQAHDWTFNVPKPGKPEIRDNYGKFVGIPAFMDIVVGRDIPYLDQVVQAGATIYSTFSDRMETSDKCLQVLINGIVKDRYTVCDSGIAAWKAVMKGKYPGGQRDLYGIWWGSEHPYTLASPTTF